MNKLRINIAIIEPSLIISEGLSTFLSQDSRINYSIFHFATTQEFIQDQLSQEIDVIIINPLLVKYEHDDFLKITSTYIGIVVGIVYSFFGKELLASFDEIIQITDEPKVIAETIHKLVTSKECFKADIQDQLSPREIDVLRNMIHGLSNKEIADQLNISIHTVISHRKNIVQKTGIKSQAGLTIYAISNKIIEIEDYQD